MDYSRVVPGSQLVKRVAAHEGGMAAMLARGVVEGDAGLKLVIIRAGEEDPEENDTLFLKDSLNGVRKFSIVLVEEDSVRNIWSLGVPQSRVVTKRSREYVAHLRHMICRGRKWRDRAGNVHSLPHH